MNPLTREQVRVVVTERDRPDKCVICSRVGDDVWGIPSVQLQLCNACRIRWRRQLGHPDYD